MMHRFILPAAEGRRVRWRKLLACLAVIPLLSIVDISCGTASGPSEPEAGDTLPRVLLMGDSIALGYAAAVRERLSGRAAVHVIPENGGGTVSAIDNLDRWLEPGGWDVIHFNWGLHDLSDSNASQPGRRLRPDTDIGDYANNLEQIVRRLKKTGASLIWATTTPVPAGDRRRVPGGAVAYNAAAVEIMKIHGVAVNDLHGHAMTRLEEFQKPQNVHFHDRGYEYLGLKVADAIGQALDSAGL